MPICKVYAITAMATSFDSTVALKECWLVYKTEDKSVFQSTVSACIPTLYDVTLDVWDVTVSD